MRSSMLPVGGELLEVNPTALRATAGYLTQLAVQLASAAESPLPPPSSSQSSVVAVRSVCSAVDDVVERLASRLRATGSRVNSASDRYANNEDDSALALRAVGGC